MRDIMMSFETDGQRQVRSFKTIMDFIDMYEKNELHDLVDKKPTKIGVIFFENELNYKRFDSLKELYNHCVAITK